MRAIATIERCVGEIGSTIACHPGNCVMNLVAHSAPNKADAARRLLREAGADALLFAGDDANDKPIFNSGQSAWHTIRVANATDARADHYVDSPEHLHQVLAQLLTMMPLAASRNHD